MRSETLDITIEEQGGDLWLHLAGPFTQEQIPTFREKFTVLIEDGIRYFVVDLQNVTVIEPGVIQLFLQLLNTLKGKRGSCKLVFNSEHLTKTFAPYRNIFSIFPDATFLRKNGIVATLQKQRRLLSRKTGIRFSRPIAFFLLIVLLGWFLSLVYIIHIQNRHIKEQQSELNDLTQWETRSRLEIENLRNRLQPLEQLGILKDTLGNLE
jgi:anti-anti-sigma factor